MAISDGGTALFLRYAAPPEPWSQVPAAALEGELARLDAAARAAWPGIDVPRDAFLRWLAERFAGDDPLPWLAGLHVADLWLACGCALAVPGAVAAFEARHLAAVPRMLAQAGYTDDSFVDEVQQRLRERLLVGPSARIGDYSGRGPLGSWVRMAAVRTAINLAVQERKYAPLPDEPSEDAVLGEDNPELVLIKRRYREELRASFRTAFARLSAEERNLLSFYLLDGLNLAEIGAIFGKHRATIARWITKTRDKISGEVLQDLRRRLRLTGSELDSMIALLQSQLDITLHGMLRGPR